MKGIYKITSPTGRIYIGQSIDIEKRKRMYIKNHCHKQQKLYASLVKYGFYEHDFEIIEECDESLLNEREEHWIEVYGTFNNEIGMNLSSGGLNKRVSEETKAKISIGNKGRKRPDLAANNLLRRGVKTGRVVKSFLGRKHSEETINKMKISALNRERRSDETKIKMSISARNKTLTESHKQKLKDWAKSGKSRIKKVINTETNEVFESAKLAAIHAGIKYDNFKAKMNGSSKNNTPYKYL